MTRVVIYRDKSQIQVEVAHKKSLLFFKLQEYKIPFTTNKQHENTAMKNNLY